MHPLHPLSLLPLSLSLYSPPPQSPKVKKSVVWQSVQETYPVQNHIHVPARIHNRVLTAQLHHFAQYAHDAVLELREVWLQDARGLRVVHGELLL